MQIIMTPFSWLLLAFYNLFDNYGIALILFAIVVKLILFPFSLKGKRGTIQMNMIQGKVQQIQKQYANNREKMNEEIQKLYAKENVNPMSGCLWSFIPLLILWPLYAIIRRPFYYMMGQTTESIQAITDALNFVPTGNAAYSELEMASWINADNLQAVQDAANSITAGLGDKIFSINFDFLGLDLSKIAQWKFWEVGSFSWDYIGLVLLPIISAGLGLVMTIVSQKTNAMNNQTNNQANNQVNKQMRTMMIISPLISLWIGFMYPAGLCVYWIINNLLSIIQEIVSGKMLKKDYERAAAARAEQERLEKEEEKRKKREAAERRAKAAEEAKNNKGKKKPAPKSEKKNRTTDAGRIGMRPYARGRCYDPERYGGVTPYQDPGAPIDEEAVEQALAAKGKLAEEASKEELTAEAPELAEETVTETAETPEAEEETEAEEPDEDESEEDENTEDEDEQSGEEA